MKSDNGADLLREMYREWPFFRSFFDLIEMVLAKADPHISSRYDEALVPNEEHRKFGDMLRELLTDTIDAVLEVSGEQQLLDKDSVEQRAINTRTEWLTPVNLEQVELLKRWRAISDKGFLKDAIDPEQGRCISDALIISMKGM